MLGAHLESEIRAQPALWRRLARSDGPARLAAAFEGEVWLIGSGSSLFAAELGALALLRRGLRAAAIPATEAPFVLERRTGASVVALSQSGRSGDLLAALDALAPARLVALTNDPDSPLASRAGAVVPLDAGREHAIPATKTVSAMMVLLALAVARSAEVASEARRGLLAAADAVERWFGEDEAAVVALAQRIALRRGVAILGSGFGVPLARELALKFKEACYLHAEGFVAGEFRHGSTAMLDATYAVLALADARSQSVCAEPLAAARAADALTLALGGPSDRDERLGPALDPPFEWLGWLVAGQMLALHVGRARFVDGDAPRGLTKFLR